VSPAQQLRALAVEMTMLGQETYRNRGPAYTRLVDGWRPISLRCQSFGADDRVDAVWEALGKKSWPRTKTAIDLMVAWLEGWEAAGKGEPS